MLPKKRSSIFIIGLIFIFAIGFILSLTNWYFFPGDVITQLPSFKQNSSEHPKNSLLADPVYQFEPWREYAKKEILLGRFPLWNNLSGHGQPFFANLQTSVLFPLNFLYYLFPTKLALWLIPMLKIYLFAVFLYLYLRSLKITRLSSIVISIIAPFTGFFWLWLLWPHTNVFLFFPLLLFCTEKLRVARGSYRYFVLISLLYSFIVFAGHPGTMIHVAIVHVIYTLFRLWKLKKSFVLFLFFALLGLGMASIQLIPFFEYVLQSTEWAQRQNYTLSYFLPLLSIGLNIIPLGLGAPYLPFYRQLGRYLNFQELLGGYVGLSVLLTVIIGFFVKRSRSGIFQFWTVVCMLSFFIAYKVWPFWLLTSLPLLNSVSNQRAIAFSGFSLLILAGFGLDYIQKHPFQMTRNARRVLLGFSIVSLIALISGVILYVYTPAEIKYAHFAEFLVIQISFIAITSVGTLFVFTRINTSRVLIGFLLVVLYGAQTVGLMFWSNPITKNNTFYPRTEIVSFLQSLPPGPILDVGNPLLPPNISLVYGLENIRTNDYLGVYYFDQLFNKNFPIRNHWNNPEFVSKASLANVNVRYILSDYDVTLTKKPVQSKHSMLFKLADGKKMQIAFTPYDTQLRQIRFLTATFNRKNSCHVKVALIDSGQKSEISNTQFDCNKVSDNMFFTLGLSKDLSPLKKYVLSFSSPDASPDNTIGLWGDSNLPYLDLLFADKKNDFLEVLRREKNGIYIFAVKHYDEVEFSGSRSVILSQPTKKIFRVISDKHQKFTWFSASYPGWEAELDGLPVKLIKNYPFLSVLVGRGTHTITFSYRPTSFLIGLDFSIGSFLILILVLLGNKIIRRSSKRLKKNKG